MRGIFLSITLLFSLVLVILLPSNAYAAEISVKSFAFEETTIIELTNDSNENVNTFRIWLESDDNFKSFKTEKGWVGEKTPKGVVIFTSSETIKPGESVKFGVKTDTAKPGINWKAVDKVDEQIDIGKVLPNVLPTIIHDTLPKDEQISKNTDPSMSKESSFRIVPEKPNVGSTIRVTGDQFSASQEFDFYIDSKKIGSFKTDENGNFMTTMKIPENQKADMADFKIIDKVGTEKSINLRIGDGVNIIPTSDDIKLTINGLPDIINRGDFLEIYGTGNPYGVITAEITSPDGQIINSRTAKIDAKGNWVLDKPVIVALDAPFGKYSAVITDGREDIVKHWTLESDKMIIIVPVNLKINAGEIMKFNGTAIPNKSIEMILENPSGQEIFADIIQIDDSGSVSFEFQTTQNIKEGTYTLIATQEKEKEYIFVGVGQLPTIPVNLEFDKLNYKLGDKAILSLEGKGSDTVNLLIIDPSDEPKGEARIILHPDGKGSHLLDLAGYNPGVYTAVIRNGDIDNKEIFAVGLRTGSKDIDVKTTKPEYLPSAPILILGDTGPNALLTITLIDPNGNKVKEKETFSNKEGKISESSFRIPSYGESGTWIINVKSGSYFKNIEVPVLATLSKGMLITVEEAVAPRGHDSTINIRVIGAKQTTTIQVMAEDKEVIKTFTLQATSAGEIKIPWPIPKGTEPGIYTFKASDGFTSANTTYTLK